MTKPQLRLSREAQIAVLRDVAERCEDIAEDIESFDGWMRDGRLIGIKEVATSQVARLINIAANLEATES